MAAPKSGPTKKVVIDETQLEALAGMGCTNKEMAAFFKCHPDTLTNNYSDAIDRGRETGKASVRRMLWAQGQKGNSVALKYLIHNVLKEKLEDKADNNFYVNSEVNQQLAKLSVLPIDEIRAMAKAQANDKAG